MAGESDLEQEIARVRQRLAEIEAEQIELRRSLVIFQQMLIASAGQPEPSTFANAPLSNNSPSAEKVQLFRSLFAGRPDVFPARWDNRKTGKSGYSPACSNEWVKGVCGKPKVKCGECPNQAFIPPSDDIVEQHLRGGNARPKNSPKLADVA